MKNPKIGLLTDIQIEQLRFPSSVRITVILSDEGFAAAFFENLKVQIEEGHVFFEFGDVTHTKGMVQ